MNNRREIFLLLHYIDVSFLIIGARPPPMTRKRKVRFELNLIKATTLPGVPADFDYSPEQKENNAHPSPHHLSVYLSARQRKKARRIAMDG